MPIIKFKKLNQRGDTILEVLISVAILSLILTTSFTLANRSSQATRQAAERGESSKFAQSEIEKLKYYLSTPNLTSMPSANSYFCLEVDAAGVAAPVTVTSPTTNIDDPAYFNNIDSRCREGANQRYSAFIYRGTAPNNANTYTTYVRWDSVTGRGVDKVDLVHRVYPDTSSIITSINNGSPISFTPPPPPPPVNIDVDIVASADCYAPGDANGGCPEFTAKFNWSDSSSDTKNCIVTRKHSLGQTQDCLNSFPKPVGTTLLNFEVNMLVDKCASSCTPTTDRNLYIQAYTISGQGNFTRLSADPTKSPGLCGPLLGWYTGTDSMWLCATGKVTFVPPEPAIATRTYNFQSCTWTNQFTGDAFDVCQPNGASYYMRRNGIINYTTSSALPGPTMALLRIDYKQWPGTVVPPGYPGYDVWYWIAGSPPYFARLPVGGGTYTGLIPIPSSSSTDFHVEWVNNGLGIPGGDEDLQIDRIRISR